ncbi:MAG: peroxiredoxin (alkyl hydroperoxide reductase subunit C) [Parvicellaceae bacterium]|jgi:peroxiredoxin (alkyl hydroperoxide reductase subunit C)
MNNDQLTNQFISEISFTRLIYIRLKDHPLAYFYSYINKANITMDNILEFQKKVTIPRIGDPAPAFQAVTTQGDINFPEDYKGEWVILFSHPADFTPVCTSEFMTFAHLEQKFKLANCSLVGLSIDGLYSHIAWLRTIREKIEFKGMKNIDVKFPLIEDISMEVAKKYGMIQPGESKTQAVRAVFFIDPKGIVRALIYYPLSLGRNFDEIYRALIAMQTSDKFSVATPADWYPGDDVIISPAGSCGVAESRMVGEESDLECEDWFFCTKKIDKEEILNALLNPEEVVQNN